MGKQGAPRARRLPAGGAAGANSGGSWPGGQVQAPPSPPPPEGGDPRTQAGAGLSTGPPPPRILLVTGRRAGAPLFGPRRPLLAVHGGPGGGLCEPHCRDKAEVQRGPQSGTEEPGPERVLPADSTQGARLTQGHRCPLGSFGAAPNVLCTGQMLAPMPGTLASTPDHRHPCDPHLAERK